MCDCLEDGECICIDDDFCNCDEECDCEGCPERFDSCPCGGNCACGV